MIGILDYGMGNISSVSNVLEFLGAPHYVIKSRGQFSDCSRLIIPGVGAYAKAMENIREKEFEEPIAAFAASGKPLLGICLGMQLLAEKGFEPYEIAGLGLIPGEVVLMEPEELRVPHVGWNGIEVVNDHPILEDVKLAADFYFVHSYRFQTKDDNSIVTTTDYGIHFPSIVANARKNVIGIQFHPEKSQKQGLKILENFLNLPDA